MTSRYAMDSALARQQLERAQCYRLVLSLQGAAQFRTLNGIVSGDSIVFHGTRKGEKARWIGQGAVVTTDEVVAQIPSYFIDPELACPATTFYRSVHARGTLVEVDGLEQKALALAAFMQKYQPEGGYLPLSDARYERTLRALLVFALRIESLTGRAKLGQNKSPADLGRLVASLWHRGQPGDARAIELVLSHNSQLEVPQFLQGPAGIRLRCWLEDSEVPEALRLIENQYWVHGVEPGVIARSHAASSVWVGAKRGDRLVATARALSDEARLGYIADVAVDPAFRRRGIASSLLELLLAHPKLRNVQKIRLHTADAHGFYERFGFRSTGAEEMLREAPAAPSIAC